MKKQLLLGVAVGALVAVSPAMAQPPALPPAVSTTLFNWTGFYVGANIGYSWGHGDFTYNEPAFSGSVPTVITGSQNLDGAIGGFQAGYNFQTGNWVLGVETDFDWTGEKGSNNFSFNYPSGVEGGTANLSGAVSAKIDWLGTLRARAGWLLTPNLLTYATGGLAYGRVNVSGTIADTFCSPTCVWSFGNSQVRVGYAVGAGIEGGIPNMPAWTWKMEYLYVDLGTMNGSGYDTDFGGSYSWSEKVTDNIFRVGVNYKVP